MRPREHPGPDTDPRKFGHRRPAAAAAVVAVLVVLAGCQPDAGAAARADESDAGPGGDSTAAESMTAAGLALVDRLDDAPVYELAADVDIVTGDVSGTMVVEVPADRGEATFRWFPNLPSLGADASLADVEVDGRPVEPDVEDTVVKVPLGTASRTPKDGGGTDSGASGRSVVSMSFEYRIPVTDTSTMPSLGGEDGLELGSIGLLGRTDDSVAMGHWFPVWLPPDVSAEPDPDGYGDIGNFPAATISAAITTASSATVVTGGVELGRSDDSRTDRTTMIEAGAGLRDLAVVILDDAEIVERPVGQGDDEILVRVVTAPAAAEHAAEVLDETIVSIEALSNAFGPYPWREFDVLAVALGSGVGGMEWPGMIWIEPGIFGGGLPGLGDLGGAGPSADGSSSDVLDMLDMLGPMLGDDLGLAIETTRPWTVAHEVGHMWWHAVVGNDSVRDPVVDEPLAQHAACLAMRELFPSDGDAVCEAQSSGQYRQAVDLLGVQDAPANQANTEFDSSLQYGAVVYGKAPGFYRALEDEFGTDAVTAALAAVVQEHAFGRIDAAGLADSLGEELGRAELVDELWSHWMEETNGDADLGTGGGLVPPGSGELESPSDAQLEDLFEDLFAEPGDPDD